MKRLLLLPLLLGFSVPAIAHNEANGGCGDYCDGPGFYLDNKELEEKGFTGTAANLRKQMEEGRRQIEENKLKEMIERNEAIAKANREKKSGFQALPPLSPEAIARTRAEWGITGEPNY